VSAPASILITGGAGFVGSAISIALKRAYPGARVCALDNLHRRGSELNLPRLREAEVDFIHGDIRSPEDLVAVDPPPDLIVECSAEASAQAGYGGSPEYLIRTNLMGAFHCLELARKVHADFLFVSTSRVYPFHVLNGLPFEEEESRFAFAETQECAGVSRAGITEDFPLAGARSLYGMSKLAAELMIQEYADAYGISCIINRCGLLTGPWQMAKSDQGVIALWVAAHYFRRPLSYIGFGGTGKQVRDFLHIQDFCDLVIRQISNFDTYQGRVWNVGGGLSHSLSLHETTDLCREITGNKIPLGSIPENRPADVRIYVTDHARVTGVDGWMPTRLASDTIADIVNWLRQEEQRLQGTI